MKLKVYTSPSCPRCEVLKETLKKLGFPFEEADVSDSEVMAELIMRDIYLEATPALECEGRIFNSDELFQGDKVNLDVIKKVLEGGK
ncbi:MAG: NrdH-redoxin [Thermoprotei archaeon]|nr:MAG: NrdH-redoxin [Thermoprotei archaeon]RLF14765.1 MAG: NrdH-redoxin [Thermoprotei archaeon]